MAPAAQKRKRGRSPHAPKQQANASNGHNDDAEEGPRKRGSISKKSGGAPAGTEARPSTRGRRRQPLQSLDEAVAEQPDDESRAGASRGKRRRQQVLQEQSKDAAEEAPSRKRVRPSPRSRGGEKTTRVRDAPDAAEPAPRRQRSRPSLIRRRLQEDGKEEVERQRHGQSEPGPRKRGRPSDQGLSPAQAPNKAPEPAKDGHTRSTRQDIGERHGQNQQQVTKRRRHSRNDAAPVSPPSAPSSPPKPYVHVVPHVRRVRQSTITAKWSTLTGPSLAAVSTVLHLAHRPILQRLSNTHQRRAHTSAALRLMTHRIARKVARGLPFPPASMPAPSRGPQPSDGGRETELNFESVLDGKAVLEAQLEPAAHAVEVLRREKDRVERELERDYDTLRRLEAGARAQVREQRSLLKKAHVLVPGATGSQQQQDENERELVFAHDEVAAAASDSAFTDLDDNETLRPLAMQLGGHAESMRSNLEQVEGLVTQLARGRSALQAVLLKHLDQSQVERVVFG